MKTYCIWSNFNLDPDSAEWKAFLKEEHPDLVEWCDKYAEIERINSEYLCDERLNLDIDAPQDILVLADLGFWNGRVNAYRELGSTHIADILEFETGCDFAEWTVESDGELRGRQAHHDGTHYFRYRCWKSEVPDDLRSSLLEDLYVGQISYDDFAERYTEKLGPVVAAVYGWKIIEEVA